ncbi:Capn15, partial [Symbiodinium pilosum]
LEGPGSVLTALAVALRHRGAGSGNSAGGGYTQGTKPAPSAKKAGLGPVQRSVFKQYQADMHRKIAEAEPIDGATEDQRIRSHEEFRRTAEIERRKEAARWAQEEAEWASRRRAQRK